MPNKNHDALVKAYNNFDSQPLRGEKLKKFYIDDFTKDSVKGIITTIRITKRFKKMLVIGHRGCGKSTILNKVAEELYNDYHVVVFSVADIINMMDVEAVDILLGTYLQVLQSVEKQGKFDNLQQSFKHFMKSFAKKDFKLEEVTLLGIALKFKVEPESRATIREGLRNQIDTLQQNISEACHHIHQQKGKDILIIIDGLDRLDVKFAERVFYDNSDLLLLPEAKIVYTFPLATYYCDDFISIRARYEDQFISVVNLQTPDGRDLESSQKALTKLILRRIDQTLITDDAINYVINMSGGLLRDVVKFMQDACKLALVDNLSVIDQSTVEDGINDHILDYYRVFDFPTYVEKVKYIAQTKKTIDKKTLVYLLRFLFVLEYRHNKELWYDVHPCLNKALALESETQ
jgi:GTPase SAR1 family protein